MAELLNHPSILQSENKSSNLHQYETITSETAFATWLQQLEQAPLFAFDTETTSLNSMNAQIVGVSFAIEAGKAAYVPLAHDYMGAPKQLDLKRFYNN